LYRGYKPRPVNRIERHVVLIEAPVQLADGLIDLVVLTIYQDNVARKLGANSVLACH